MKSIVIMILMFIVGEIVANIIFYFVRNFFNNLSVKPDESQNPLLSILKGTLERFVLFIFLYFGHMPILILFGALKIGTRLKEAAGSSISNDYFLIGNLLSVLIAFVYYLIANKFIAIEFT